MVYCDDSVGEGKAMELTVEKMSSLKTILLNKM